MKIQASPFSRSSWIAFIVLSLTCGCANKNFFPASPLVYDTAPLPEHYADSVTVQAGKQYKHSKLYHFFLGHHYREVWATPVRVRVLHLEQERGGLEVQSLSGSLQTKGLTLADAAARAYALRSVDKDPALGLSPFWKKTFGVNFLRDQTAALNPYAALVVAPLARAAGVPQPNPELVYVRKQDPALGKFKDTSGDRVYMLEEKFSGKQDIPSSLEGAVAMADTKKMLQNIYEAANHRPDQLRFAKARLFDIFINDRDRHEGQWEWAVFEKQDNYIYTPIAKDRDQAFYNYHKGVTPFLLGKLLNMQKFQPFKADYRNLPALTVKSVFIDNRLLNEVTLAQFDSLARELQLSLTDAVLEAAVRALPPEVYGKAGPTTLHHLKSRRDKLPAAAEAYYNLLAKEVMVVGSDENEQLEVKRLNDQQTEVTVYRKTDYRQVYRRIFEVSETKKVTIYGLGGDDSFKVSGNVRKGIVIALVGGEGEDTMEDASGVAGFSKKTIVYDTRSGNRLTLGAETKNKTSDKSDLNKFKRKKD